jgi:sarcosine oxidase subunit beta
VRQSGRHPAELPLAQAAVHRWETLGEKLGADLEYRQEGNLRLARTPQEVEVIAKMVEAQQALGLEISFLPDNQAVRQVAPALSEAVLAAAYCPTDGHANPTAVVHAFAAAAERAGARILTRITVTGIDVAGGRIQGVQTTTGPLAAGAVAIAAGVHSDQLCAAVGLDWPLSITHVSVMQTVPLPPLLKQVLGVANADFAGRQEVGGRLRMTTASGSWTWPEGELAADDVQPPAQSLGQILERGSLVLPAVAQARVARVWGGLIAMTPDGLPVIERSPEIEGLVIAAGFSGHGFCLGPVTGQLICELIKGEEPSLPLGPFRRARFVGMTTSATPELHG